MSIIKGISVDLYECTITGRDAFNAPIYTPTKTTVNNVLVFPVEDAEIVNSIQLHGVKVVYEICIPKGDTHTWEGCRVDFFGESFVVIGDGKEYIDANVPLDWNKKFKVARYES